MSPQSSRHHTIPTAMGCCLQHSLPASDKPSQWGSHQEIPSSSHMMCLMTMDSSLHNSTWLTLSVYQFYSRGRFLLHRIPIIRPRFGRWGSSEVLPSCLGKIGRNYWGKAVPKVSSPEPFRALWGVTNTLNCTMKPRGKSNFHSRGIMWEYYDWSLSMCAMAFRTSWSFLLVFKSNLYRANYINLTEISSRFRCILFQERPQHVHHPKLRKSHPGYGFYLLFKGAIRFTICLWASKRHLVGYWKESNAPWPGPTWPFYALGSITWCCINWKEVSLTKLC